MIFGVPFWKVMTRDLWGKVKDFETIFRHDLANQFSRLIRVSQIVLGALGLLSRSEKTQKDAHA